MSFENTSINQSTSQVYTVEQLNTKIRQLLEGQIGVLWVQGEISNFKPHTSGHFYFSIKDSKSQISAVMFRGANSKLKFKPHDGLQVLIRARITVYEPRGTYQIACEYMEPVGAGALQKQFEQLRDKLKLEGLFEPARKKQIPLFPGSIAVVTSPTGAAIQDILNILRRRAPAIEIVIVPSLVQGPQCAEALRVAFRQAEKTKPDVIIIGRGGGSMEDLWGFNDEGLARQIASSEIPVISAVGHEIDFTICDFVSDLRAPTPSAAAELVAQSTIEIKQRIQQKERLILLAMSKAMHGFKEKIKNLNYRLTDPRRKLADLIQKNDELFSRLAVAVEQTLNRFSKDILIFKGRLKNPSVVIEEKKQQLRLLFYSINRTTTALLSEKKHSLTHAMSLLDSLSPLKVVDRGYAIVKQNGNLIKSIKQIKTSDKIQIQLSDGFITAAVDGTSSGVTTK
jgi:exodeoxyribonuclease VII large subunit